MSGQPLDEALGAIRWLKSRLQEAETSQREPIAVVGLACRFPGGVDSPEAFWNLLAAGTDATSEVPRERWNMDDLYDPDPNAAGKIVTRRGGFLSAIEMFDAEFFGIASIEALAMDPQQRLMLEVAFEAIESSGITLEQLKAVRSGVFVGVSWSDYLLRSLGSQDPQMVRYSGTGTANSIVANRLSYTFDLKGPSVAVDTACSSSVVALHLGCESLRTRQSDVVVIGGVNAILHPFHSTVLSKMNALAPDGRCKTFDAAANGYARGEGCGALILKRLSDARADGDKIWALVRGSALNQDGRSTGLTVPNMHAQIGVIQSALEFAGLPPEALGYIEAHGTGTILGDVAEVEALSTVMAKRSPADTCALGSVKSNIGHLEAAAGIASLIKVVLAIQKKQLPASLHYRNPNPNIPFASIPLKVQTELGPWPNETRRRVAGVSAFSIGGANTHAILSEPDPEDVERSAEIERAALVEAPFVLPISARSGAALNSSIHKWIRHLESEKAASLRDIAYTASVRRTHFKHRAAIVASSTADAVVQLRSQLTKGVVPNVPTKVAFVFSGQGPQWWGMGRELFATVPAYRESVERCEAIVKARAGFSLVEELGRDEGTSRLAETAVAQVALVALQVSLAAVWRSWGVEPAAVVGHSVGEIAAAHVAGVLSLEDALELAVQRGRLLQQATGLGKMASVELTSDEAEALVKDSGGRLSVAAMNGPRASVLSGEAAALAQALEVVRGRQRMVKELDVNYAFHTAQMASYVQPLTDACRRLSPQAGTLPIASTVTGDVRPGTEFVASYWGSQIREPVRFSQAIESVASLGIETFLEIGPHPVLGSAILQTLEVTSRKGHVLASLRRGTSESRSLLESLGRLHCLGYPIDWSKQYLVRGQIASLPSYPWQQERYWVGSSNASSTRRVFRDDVERSAHPLLQRHMEPSHERGGHIWETTLTLEAFPYLRDHVVHGSVIVPGMFWTAMALAAGDEAFGASFDGLTDVSFVKALAPAGPTNVQLVLTTESSGGASFKISSRPERAEGTPWELHAAGKMVVREYGAAAADPVSPLSLDDIKRRCAERLEGRRVYEGLRENGIEFGPLFRACKDAHYRAGESLCELEFASAARSRDGDAHTILLDAGFHGLVVAMGVKATYLPTSIERVRLVGHPGRVTRSHAVLREGKSDDTRTADIVLTDTDGAVAVSVSGVRLQRLAGTITTLDPALFEIAWMPVAVPIERPTPEGTWLIVGDGDGLGSIIAQRLQASGATTVAVRRGEKYAKVSEREYVVPIGQPQHWDAMLKDVPSCSAIVDLSSLDVPASSGSGTPAWDEVLHLGTSTALHAVQAIARAHTKSPRLWLVTHGARATRRGASASVTQAPLWGVGAALVREHPELQCTMIDLDPSQSSSSADGDRFVDALLTAKPHERLAIRDGALLVERMIPARAKASPWDRSSSEVRVRNDGTYLITGGLGGLGLVVASWLVDRGAKHLVLVTRRADRPEATSALDALRKRGADVRVVSADVSDPDAMAAALQRSAAEMPRLRGIFHCAGVVDDAVITNMTTEKMLAVMAKAQGACTLHSLSARHELDHFVLFSSVASVLGSPGQANYAAANAVLDALAHERRRAGLVATSINWGPWSEVGMAASATTKESFRGFSRISPQEGVALLEKILGSGHSQVVAVRLDPHSEEHGLRNLPLLAQLRDAAAPAAVPPAQSTLDRIKKALPILRPKILEAYMQATLAKILGRAASSLDPTTPLAEFGFDSLMIVSLRIRFQTDLKVAVTPAEVLNNASVVRLGQLLLAKIAQGDPK